MRLDSLVHSVKNVARMSSDNEAKEGLKVAAKEILDEYVRDGEITAEARSMLLRLLNAEEETS